MKVKKIESTFPCPVGVTISGKYPFICNSFLFNSFLFNSF